MRAGFRGKYFVSYCLLEGVSEIACCCLELLLGGDGLWGRYCVEVKAESCAEFFPIYFSVSAKSCLYLGPFFVCGEIGHSVSRV